MLQGAMFFQYFIICLTKTSEKVYRKPLKKSPGGEIGRHARFRFWCRKVCRFESYPGQSHRI
jgi:hypothetical protein